MKLAFQALLEEVRVGDILLLGRVLGDWAIQIGHRSELQLAAELADPVAPQIGLAGFVLMSPWRRATARKPSNFQRAQADGFARRESWARFGAEMNATVSRINAVFE
jgi:hypothetical protein